MVDAAPVYATRHSGDDEGKSKKNGQLHSDLLVLTYGASHLPPLKYKFRITSIQDYFIKNVLHHPDKRDVYLKFMKSLDCRFACRLDSTNQNRDIAIIDFILMSKY